MRTQLICLILLCFSLLQGCAQTGDKPAVPAVDKSAAEKQGTDPDAVALVFSVQPSVTGKGDPANWCRAAFSEAIPAYPEKAGENQYFFLAAAGGIYKLNVQAGNAVASFLLRPVDRGTIEIFTSDNYPECLSNRANHTLSETRIFDDYDNHSNITFTLHAQKAGAGFHVTLEFPPTVQYGLTVHRCTNCQ